MADYVLTGFGKDEMTALPQVIDAIVDGLELFITDGLPKAMSLYNNKNLLP
jgi:PTH1 family peptidyl-tRNA hydrolase